jgi:hypothetical protein
MLLSVYVTIVGDGNVVAVAVALSAAAKSRDSLAGRLIVLR